MTTQTPDIIKEFPSDSFQRLLGAAIWGCQTEESLHYALASIDDQIVFVSSTQVCYTVMYV